MPTCASPSQLMRVPLPTLAAPIAPGRRGSGYLFEPRVLESWYARLQQRGCSAMRLLPRDRGWSQAAAPGAPPKLPAHRQNQALWAHRAGFGVNEEQSNTEHRDRQDTGSQTLAASPLPSAHYRDVWAPIRALMDEPKAGDPHPRGALHPSHGHHISGRQPAADPGSGKGKENTFLCDGFGSRGCWQWVQAAQNEPAPIPLPFGKKVATAGASRLPKKHHSFLPLLMIYWGRSLIFHRSY